MRREPKNVKLLAELNASQPGKAFTYAFSFDADALLFVNRLHYYLQRRALSPNFKIERYRNTVTVTRLK